MQQLSNIPTTDRVCYLLATWRVIASSVEGSSDASVSYIGNRSRSSTVYHMYIAMLEPQPATGGPTSSVEAEERLFHSLAVDTKKLFLCKSVGMPLAGY